MAAITLRSGASGKGSPLTIAEVDDNFNNLNIEVGQKLDKTSYTAADILTKLKTVDSDASGLNATTLKSMDPVSTNTPNSVVARDASGNFSAGIITATIEGTITNGVVTSGNYADPSWLSISAAKVGLGNVTNESKVTMFTNPALTGIPTAPTAAPGTSTTQIATTAFVQNVAGALGTMSSQNSNAVNISGGTISGTSINTYTVGSNSTGAKTISSAAPTGGNDGDIWYQV